MAAGYSVNKAVLGSSSTDAGDAWRPSSKRHGGEKEKVQAEPRGLASGCPGVLVPQNHGEHSRWPKIWLPTLVTSGWSLSKPATADASSTSMWRPLLELAAAFLFLSVPSGVVPGAGEDGRGLSSCYSSKCRGPDCFFQDLFEVFVVKVRDWFVNFLFFGVLDVNVPALLN